MPRTRLDRYAKPEEPPIDWLKAAVLERLDAKGYTLKRLSAETGIGYENMRALMRRPPMAWKPEHRDNVCRVLGIKVRAIVDGQPPA